MSERQHYGEADPRQYTTKLKEMLTEVLERARRDGDKVEDPRARSLFETTAEVLTGLRTAVEYFERHSEPALRKAS